MTQPLNINICSISAEKEHLICSIGFSIEPNSLHGSPTPCVQMRKLFATDFIYNFKMFIGTSWK